MLLGDSKQPNVSSLDALLLNPLPPETRTRLIRFGLDEHDSVLLPLEDLIEILSVKSTDVLPIPEMPSWTIGICNWRGEMLWMIDFNQFVGYPSLFGRSPSLAVLVVQCNEQSIASQASTGIGVVVPEVKDIELHDLQQLQPPAIGFFEPNLLPLVRGVLPGCNDAVLNLQALIQSPVWHQHARTAA